MEIPSFFHLDTCDSAGLENDYFSELTLKHPHIPSWNPTSRSPGLSLAPGTCCCEARLRSHSSGVEGHQDQLGKGHLDLGENYGDETYSIYNNICRLYAALLVPGGPTGPMGPVSPFFPRFPRSPCRAANEEKNTLLTIDYEKRVFKFNICLN